jgi:hypothetical protein
VILSDAEAEILVLIDSLQSCLRSNISPQFIYIDNLDNNRDHPAWRQADRLKMCWDAVIQWRTDTWRKYYSDCAWGPKALLPDGIVSTLASNACISSIKDIKCEAPDWEFVNKYSLIILDIIRRTDDTWKEHHELELQAKKDEQKRCSIETKERRDEDQCEQKQAETACRRAERRTVNTIAYQMQPQPSQASHPYLIHFIPYHLQTQPSSSCFPLSDIQNMPQ